MSVRIAYATDPEHQTWTPEGAHHVIDAQAAITPWWSRPRRPDPTPDAGAPAWASWRFAELLRYWTA